jgi:hypothetical protein
MHWCRCPLGRDRPMCGGQGRRPPGRGPRRMPQRLGSIPGTGAYLFLQCLCAIQVAPLLRRYLALADLLRCWQGPSIFQIAHYVWRAKVRTRLSYAREAAAHRSWCRSGYLQRVWIHQRSMRIPMKSSTCSDHADHSRSEATPASTLYSQVVDMGKGESTFRRDSPCRLSR